MDVKCPNCGTNNNQDSEFSKKCGIKIKESDEQSIPTKTFEASKEELATGSTFTGRYRITEDLVKKNGGPVLW